MLTMKATYVLSVLEILGPYSPVASGTHLIDEFEVRTEGGLRCIRGGGATLVCALGGAVWLPE